MSAKTAARAADSTLVELLSTRIRVNRIDVPGQPPVPRLAHKLDRVLFSPGVHVLKDARTNVYNFDPELEKIMPITEFDFSRVAPFVRADYDERLSQLAQTVRARFLGSTSSLTPFLMQLHLAVSNFKPPQIMSLPKYFPGKVTNFTATQRAPAGGRLKYNPRMRVHSVVGYSSQDLILSLLGHNLEAMLTTSASEFRQFRKSAAAGERAPPRSTYSYSQVGAMLMRSQLDCRDARLPGSGTFDLKTRACCAVRYDIDYAQINNGTDYQIRKLHGEYESYAREFFELVRSAMFKYSLQARIGGMDGIFLAYHNVRRMFGFQYLPLTEIDKIFHTAQLLRAPGEQPQGERADADGAADADLEARFAEVASHTADAEFRLSVELLNALLQRLVDVHGATSDVHFALHADAPSSLLVFADECHADDRAGLLAAAYTPRRLRAFRVNLRQRVNARDVTQSQCPGVQTLSDAWEVRAEIEDLSAFAANLLRETRAHYVQQRLVSKPHTADPTSAEVSELLELLPDATAQQKLLRRLGQLGSEYQEWDDKRPKLVYS